MPGVFFILVDCKIQNFKNLSIQIQSDPKTHTVLRIAEHCLVKIDPELVQRLGISDGDLVSQLGDGIDTIRLVFAKNAVTEQ